MKKQQGFTLIELIAVIVLATFVTGLFLVQKSDLNQRHEDAARKSDINAIHYYLEGVYFSQHAGYPVKLDATALKGLDPDSLKDPKGTAVNEKDSDYSYQPTGCQKDVCTGYKLTANLASEAPFVKTNPSR